MSTIKYILQSFRLITSITSGLISFIIMYFNINDASVIELILRSIPMILVTGIGFIINDIGDLEYDKQAKKNRPITMELLSKSSAIFSIIIFSIIMFSIEILFQNLVSFLILFSTYLLVFFYTFISKKIPYIKNFVTAILCISPFVYAQIISNINPNLFILGIVFIFITGRELLIDASVDFIGDSNAGLKTLAVILNPFYAQLISWTLMLTALILTRFFIIDFPLIFSTSLISFVCCFILFYLFKKQNLSIRLMLLVMITTTIFIYI
ncbi:MAG: UbiA family prenyltransferase [Spirochaetales bacterium]|nr:UbiA family prenyltransferase [Spirochaetales bacterium]